MKYLLFYVSPAVLVLEATSTLPSMWQSIADNSIHTFVAVDGTNLLTYCAVMHIFKIQKLWIMSLFVCKKTFGVRMER